MSTQIKKPLTNSIWQLRTSKSKLFALTNKIGHEAKKQG